MEYLFGILLALAAGALGTIIGFDRERTYYPVIMIVIASYYCLFATMGGTATALLGDAALMGLFLAGAIIGYRTTLWIIVLALTAHGTMDFLHEHLIANAGVPIWWPGFCAAFDITAAAYLAWRLHAAEEPRGPATRTHNGHF